MQLPENIVRFAKGAMGEEEGGRWLNTIPAIVNGCARRWSLTIGAPLGVASINYLVSVTLRDGTPAVLKVCLPGEEYYTEAQALRLCDGRGAVHLLDADDAAHALLLERVSPGEPLSRCEDGRQVVCIALDVMRRYWRPVPAQHAFPSLDDWLQHMFERWPRVIPPGHAFPVHWIERVRAMYGELAVPASQYVVLHGDLHHDNILSSAREGWLAIDPKGITGPPVWETGPLILNITTIPDPDLMQETLVQYAGLMASGLGVETRTLVAWAVVRCVLSAYWSVEDHSPGWQETLRRAELLSTAPV